MSIESFTNTIPNSRTAIKLNGVTIWVNLQNHSGTSPLLYSFFMREYVSMTKRLIAGTMNPGTNIALQLFLLGRY
jgi:hypothetical protein